MNEREPLPGFYARWRRRVALLAESWVDDRCGSKAAALAFYAVFSLAPLLLVVAGVVGVFFDSIPAMDELTREARELVGPVGANLLRDMLQNTRSGEQAGFSALLATIVLIIGTTAAFTELKESLDAIWRAPPHAPRSAWAVMHSRLVSFGLVVTVTFLMLASLAVNTVLALTPDRMLAWMGIEEADFARFLGASLSLGILYLLVLLVYKLLPSLRISWSDALKAAGLTTALLGAGRALIGIYLRHGSVTSVYGAAGSLAVLLLWIYYCAVIFFFGAEVARLWLHIGHRNSAEAEARADG